MNAIFEQPRHLNVVEYHRFVRAVWPVLLVCGGLFSALAVFGLWLEAAAGEQIEIWRWIAAGGAGWLMVGVIWIWLVFETSRRRYVEFRGDRLFLSQQGVVAIGRFIAWSLLPDPIDPRYTRLQLVYRFGRGRKRWIMLLDDDKQISELRNALSAAIPQQGAEPDGPNNSHHPGQ